MVETGVLEAGWSVPGVTRPKSSKGSDIGRNKKGPRLFPGNLGWQEKLNL